ncbi:MAG: TetR/AcrR family transcriptional regulator [Rhizomicrobium sp.]
MSSRAAAQPEKFPRRTIRKQKTRERIVAAASKLFQELGYSEATLASIADEADVHVTTLFTHFSSKKELADALSDASLDRLSELIGEAKGKVPFFRFIREVITSTAKSYQANPSPHVILGLVSRGDPELTLAGKNYEQQQIELLADYIAAEYTFDLVRDYEPILVAGLVISATTIAHARWVDSKGRSNLLKESLAAVDAAEALVKGALKART